MFEVKDTNKCGKSLFSKQHYVKNQPILQFYGSAISRKDISDFSRFFPAGRKTCVSTGKTKLLYWFACNESHSGTRPNNRASSAVAVSLTTRDPISLLTC